MTDDELQPVENDPAPEDSEAKSSEKEPEGSGEGPPDVEETLADPKATPAAGGTDLGEEGGSSGD